MPDPDASNSEHSGAHGPPVNISPAPAPAPADLASLVARLPLWQRRILAHIQAGLSSIQAAAAINVSPASLQKACKDYPAFAEAVTQTEAGVTLLGVAQAKELAIARASRWIDKVDAIATDDRTTPVIDKQGNIIGERDRVANRDKVAALRLGLEAAQVIGGAGTTVQVAIVNTGANPLEPPPPPQKHAT